MGRQNGTDILEDSLTIPKLDIHLLCDLVITHLDIYPNDLKTHFHTKILHRDVYNGVINKLPKLGSNQNVL
jgi:hypothetical protein